MKIYFVLYISAEKRCGRVLRGIDRADLKEMGVKTMGRRILLLEQIKALLGSNSSFNSTG